MTNPPAKGLDLIKRFENLHLSAYPDPKTKGEPYTIGWGSTRRKDGSVFKLGDKITREEADNLLDFWIRKSFFPAVQKLPYYSEMNEEMVGAMLSFAYNLGAYFYGAKNFDTISKNLRERDWGRISDTLILYRERGSDVEAGLKKRRVAEAALWSEGLSKMKQKKQQILALRDTILKKEPIQSYQLVPGQRIEVPKGAGYQILNISEAIDNHSKVVLDYDGGVWHIYNPHWEVTSVDGFVEAPNIGSKILKVRYFSQRDSTTAHAQRMCFSSSCAMMADYLNPSAIQVSGQEDDYYMKRYVFKYGDTTNPQAQISALRDLGITVQFRKNLNQQDIINQIDKGIPVPVGILHHGPVSAPRGGGHWIDIIGYDKNAQQWIVHDPYGELDIVNGGYYGSTNGANQRYSFKNLSKRWMVEGPNTGWGVIATAW